MTAEASSTPNSPDTYVGEVVYLHAFDVAYELSREPVRELLGQPVEAFAVDASRRNPRLPFSYKPQMVRLPALERHGPHGPVRIERTVKLLPVGAISISVKVPFTVPHLGDLVAYHDLQFREGALADEVRRLAEEVVRALRGQLVRPHAQLAEEEAYTVFCITATPRARDGSPWNAERWCEAHRRKVAALLTQETDTEALSRQEAEESTSACLSYYDTDLVVVDWDAALIIDEPGDAGEALYIMELANLQLAELEAYDRILDHALERSYRDLGERPMRSRGDVLRELRELRIDLARFSDELSNITKFFGDWHLARLYEKIAGRFHLADWHRNIDDKLKTLDDLYQLLKHDQTNRWMMILEVTIVLLFIIDLVMIFVGMKFP